MPRDKRKKHMYVSTITSTTTVDEPNIRKSYDELKQYYEVGVKTKMCFLFYEIWTRPLAGLCLSKKNRNISFQLRDLHVWTVTHPLTCLYCPGTRWSPTWCPRCGTPPAPPRTQTDWTAAVASRWHSWSETARSSCARTTQIWTKRWQVNKTTKRRRFLKWRERSKGEQTPTAPIE